MLDICTKQFAKHSVHVRVTSLLFAFCNQLSIHFTSRKNGADINLSNKDFVELIRRVTAQDLHVLWQLYHKQNTCITCIHTCNVNSLKCFHCKEEMLIDNKIYTKLPVPMNKQYKLAIILLTFASKIAKPYPEKKLL